MNLTNWIAYISFKRHIPVNAHLTFEGEILHKYIAIINFQRQHTRFVLTT